MAKINITLGGQTKSVSFTTPQANIMEQLLRGRKATYINTHHISGGDFVWYEEDGNYWGASCVGYRAFNGAMQAIKKAFSLNRQQFNELYESYIVYNQ